MNRKKYPIVPGRGLNVEEARQKRLDFLAQLDVCIPNIARSALSAEDIRGNIESYIGSVEIPLGLAGPLLMRKEGVSEEYVFAPVGTLEGALLASMNRGAKAVSLSGGFEAFVLRQRMSRGPMFIFENVRRCLRFKTWVESRFREIKEMAEKYSNHARLMELEAQLAGRAVHLRFIYETGDAAGQNMTTSCTAPVTHWMAEAFAEEAGFAPLQYMIEGNASSDKKVSFYSVNQGRGVQVVAECVLEEAVLQKILRVSAEDMLEALRQSQTLSKLDGMLGYNINVANALAGIFVATGQDLACLHESGVGILHMEKTEAGLYCNLQLPALVIGTVGGGTHLEKQREALMMMDCYGKGKLERFAGIIAGFALALELSTFAAIVGGQFAKAHERLGRNKPVRWLLKAELDETFIRKNLKAECLQNFKGLLSAVDFSEENGIIINLTGRVSRKLIGFSSFRLLFEQEGKAEEVSVLLKSKPLDREVIQGLHFMGAAIDPALADLISEYSDQMEFRHSHLKEILMYRFLDEQGICSTPFFYGSYVQKEREIYTLLIELLDKKAMRIFNAENQPECWDMATIKKALGAIHEIHALFAALPPEHELFRYVLAFEPGKARPLYLRFAQLVEREYTGTAYEELSHRLVEVVYALDVLPPELEKMSKTIIHNDFNPRNVGVREGGEICIYDWELAVWNFPQRDVVEFLSFVLPENFEPELFFEALEYSYELQGEVQSRTDWKLACAYALCEFLATRVSFYLLGNVLMDYPFAERIFVNAFRMMDLLCAEKILFHGNRLS